MDAHTRKIDLFSPQDLTYLHANITAVAQQKLDTHFPPSAVPPGEEDAFRTKVEALVHQYITTTLTLALPSISINGIPGLDALKECPSLLTPSAHTSSEDESTNYEDYDPALAAKVRALYATLEQETTRVAEMRREAPARAAGLFVEKLCGEIEAEERGVEEVRRRVVEEAGRGELGIGLEREGVVREGWEKGVKGLEGLREITEAVARAERARGVVREVGGN
ncbi:hypothetical protein MMC13_000174 [Lambiella insularis]|nr:hypothetical protein [Lambiella insularis]